VRATRPSARGSATLVLAVTLAVASLGVVSFDRPAVAQAPVQQSFGYTGGLQYFDIPVDVHAVTILLVGGPGGTVPNGLGGVGGVSGAVIGTFKVEPGDRLTVWVGGNGGHDGGWGFRCGGGGGATPTLAPDGRGGGGATAVTVGDFSLPAGDCNPSARPADAVVLAVAGGGGGGGADAFIEGNPTGPLVPGGNGGNGGNPAQAGGNSGGCGGCRTGNGTDGADQVIPGEGGAGGGGGGYRSGAGGDDPTNGGGGGLSQILMPATNSAYLPGAGAGDGHVLITTGHVEVFDDCTPNEHTTTVPVGRASMQVHATGGSGGTPDDGGTPGASGTGGSGGEVDATFPVEPGDPVRVVVGCRGHDDPGRGFGIGGHHGVGDENGLDGGGGGGSTAVFVNGRLLAHAAAGGAGGGPGGSFAPGGGVGGFGGNGGDAGGYDEEPTRGSPGQSSEGGGGGCAACKNGPDGKHGHDANDLSHGGGGGGSGAGDVAGGGGNGGHFPSGGGGGGGGGLDFVDDSAMGDTFQGTADQIGADGLVELTFGGDGPAAVVVHGGSKQRAPLLTQFAEPLTALVTDLNGHPLANTNVTFTLVEGTTDAWGTFPSAVTVHTATTNAQGIATSPPITANVTPGEWTATATVGGLAPARYSLTNTLAETTTAVTISPSPAYSGQQLTVRAIVTADNPLVDVPSGTVHFTWASSSADVTLDSNGVATLAVDSSTLPAGAATTFTAEYEGSTEHAPSTGHASVLVERVPTATSVTSTPNPSQVDEAVAVTATISVPSGLNPYAGAGAQVQFQIDGVDFGAPVSVVSSQASITIPANTLTTGTHLVSAIAAQTATHAGSTGTHHQVADPTATAVTVTSTANPIEYGAGLTLQATVSAANATPTGTVDFAVDGNPVCQDVALDGVGEASCVPPTPLLPGAHDVVVDYAGDATFDPSQGRMTQQVVPARTDTAVSTSPASPTPYGSAFVVHAQVSRRDPGVGTPGGTVQFAVDGVPLGDPVALDGTGAAASPPVAPHAGAHTVTATYGGDARFSGSESQGAHVVQPAATTVVLSASAEPSLHGAPVTFHAQVGSATGALPTGTVTFRVDGVDVGSVPLDGLGAATSPPVSTLKPGTHTVSAVYDPRTDGDFLGSSTAIEHVVEQPTKLWVSANEDPIMLGTPLDLRAHIRPLTRGGTVAFAIDGLAIEHCQAVPVVDNEARCSVGAVSAGLHVATASFSGASPYGPSQGELLVEVVGAPVRSPTFTG